MNGIKLANLQDMRGGLNLRADPFELGKDESPSLLNVDLDPRGGVEQRKGTSVFPVTQANPNLLNADSASSEGSVGWIGPVGCVVAQDSSFPIVGAKSALATCTVAGTIQATDSVGGIAVTPSTVYTAFMQAMAVDVPRSMQVAINWFTAGNVFISTSFGVASTVFVGTYSTFSVTATAPGTAAKATMMFSISAAAVGNRFRFDANHFAKGVNPNFYLDPTITTQLDSEVYSLFQFQTPNVSQLFASTQGALWWSTVGTNQWNLLGGWPKSQAVQFKDKLFVVAPTAPTLTWDGATLTTLGAAYNDDLTAPTGLNAPRARYAAAFQGSLWVAGTNEGGVDFRNRLRFSHPNQPADFRSFDFIDVDTGLDGDVITGLVPFGDRLLIFKRHAIYAVSGTGPDDFQVYPITQELGAIDQLSIASTDVGVYFFSWPEGVFLYDGKGVQRQSDRIHPIIDEGLVPAAKQSLIRLGWANRRLWVSVPWRANAGDPEPTTNTRVFVLDPTLSKQGSWTVYDIGVGMMRELNVPGGALQFLGSYQGVGWLMLLDDPTVNAAYDTAPSGARTAIRSYYRTRWVDLGQPAQKKRWRRPEFVIHSLNARAALPVQVFLDYDSANVQKTFSLSTSQDSSVMLWGDNWGETWDLGALRSTRSEVIRGSAIGQARAVQLQVNGPDPLQFNLIPPNESTFETSPHNYVTAFTGPNVATVATSTAKAFEGATSLLVTATSTITQIGAYTGRVIPVSPGQSVVWSYWSLAKGVTGQASASINWFNANFVSVGISRANPTNSLTAWTPSFLQAVAPPGAVYAQPYIELFGGLTVGQGLYVDLVQFYPADSAVGLPWGLNAIAFKFIPKPVRS